MSFCKWLARWWWVAIAFCLSIVVLSILILIRTTTIDEHELLSVHAKLKTDNISTNNKITRNYIKYATEEDRIISRGQWPWNAIIFMYDGYWKNICLGTIVSPHIIVTAAQCVYNTTTYRGINSTLFRVVVGNLSYKFSDSDSSSQQFQVSSIHICDDYVGAITGHEQNIALVGLSNDIKFNDAIRPVCIDWHGNKSFTSSSLAMIAGWNDSKQTDSNRKIDLNIVQYMPRKMCIKSYLDSPYLRYLSFDKFCLISNKNINDKDMGAGVIFAIEGTCYLKGILGINTQSEFLISTNTSMHSSWIEMKIAVIDREMRCVGFLCSNKCIEMKRKCDGIKDCEDGSDENIINCGKKELNETCILPNQNEGASYKLLICDNDDEKCIRKPLQSVHQYTKIRVICGVGYATPTDKTDLAICTPEGWFPENPQCIKLCPSLEKENMDINCTFQGSPTTCKEYVMPGTIATYNCKWPYMAKNTLDDTKYSECLSSGEWDGRLPDCTAECGRVHFNKPLSENSSSIWEGKYPWHVGLYQIDGENNTIYRYFCGGVMITPLTILTAALCLGYGPFDNKLYSIGAGKLISDWGVSEPHQQYRLVKSATKPEIFTQLQEHDIAILDVQDPFLINYYVSPACVDWHKNAIPTGTYGTISTWGVELSEEGSNHSQLQEFVLPTIDIKKCREEYYEHTLYLSYDKFCAIIRRDLLGSSGSPMTFSKGDIQYVYGILSLKAGEEEGLFALTNITNHVDMIKKHLDSQPQNWSV